MIYELLFGFLRGLPREIGKDVISWGKFVPFVVNIKERRVMDIF